MKKKKNISVIVYHGTDRMNENIWLLYIAKDEIETVRCNNISIMTVMAVWTSG